MKVNNWTDPQEIKELMCGNKMIVTACSTMNGCAHLFCLDYIYMEE